jgi:hypothetical protein
MLLSSRTDLSPERLIQSYGSDAEMVIISMLDHAVKKGAHDEALELDRLRRKIVRALAS